MTKTATAVRLPTARRAPAGTAPLASGTFRPDVEGLRAVAVALVVLFHAGVPGLTGGYVGVDVFFVISGYLITGLMLREAEVTGRVSLARFYARRARRLLPAGCLVLVVVILAARPWLGFLRADEIALDGVWATLFSSNFHFAAQGVDYLASQAPPSPLQHFWSLAVEEQFYLIWPATLVLLLAFARRSGAHRVVPFTLGCAVGGSLAWSALHVGTWSYFSPVTRAWELGAGALLAVAGADPRPASRRGAAALAWLGLALIVISAVAYRQSTPFPGIAAAVPVLGAVLVLAGRAESLLGRAPLQWLGRISYSLYLWHWPILTIAEQAHGRTLSGPMRALLVLISVGLAAATYALVESPVRGNPRLARSPVLTFALALLLIAAPLAAARWTMSTSPGAGGSPEHQPRLGAPSAHVQV